MGAVDRLRSAIAHLRQQPPYSAVHTPVVSRSTVMVDVDDAEALCDLADAARDAIAHYEHCAICGDHTDNCRCIASEVRAALARLEDKEEDDGS